MSYFYEFQRCLDNNNILIDRMIATSINFVENFRSAHRYLDIPINPQNLSAFVIKDVQTGCADTIVLKVSEYMSHQPYGKGFQQHEQLQRDAMVFVWTDIYRRLELLDLIQLRQTQNTFRPWQPEDLPFLIHFSAVMKTTVHFQATITVTSFSNKSSYEIMVELLRNSRIKSRSTTTRLFLIHIQHNLDTLLALNKHTDQLRGCERNPELDEHDNCGIVASIDLVRQLTDDIQSHLGGGGMPLSALTHRLRMTGGKRYRIPMVANPSRLHVTFDCIHSAQLLDKYYEKSL